MAVDYVWRFAVTRLNGRILGLLDRRSTARKATFALGKAAQAVGTVAADNPAVNIVQGDGYPILAEGVRNIYGFRKEGSTPAWVCRFGGRLLLIEDNVEESQGAAPYSNWTAYDPRQILYKRPVLNDDGTLIGKNGLSYEAGGGVGPAQIALDFLQRSIDFQGEVGILTSGGTIESTLATDISFVQGTTVGEAWDQLEEGGYIDIILTPTYDLTEPGALATLNIYEQAGTTKRKAIFAWDQPGRSLVAVNRAVDGTQRANKIRYYAGQGGPVADVGTVSNPASIATYGEYWAQRFFPASPIKGAVGDLAAAALLVQKNGQTTWRVTPSPAQATVKAPVPFLEYNLGDIVPIYVSSRLRQQASVLQRIIEIPVDLRDDGTETISQLSFSADGVGDDESESSGDSAGGGGPPPDGIVEALGAMNLTGSDYVGIDSGLRAALSVAIIGNADPDLSALAAESTPIKLIYMDPMIASDPDVYISFGVDKDEAEALGVLATDGGGNFITGIADAAYYLPAIEAVAYRDRFFDNVSAVLAANPGFGVYFDNVDIDYHNLYAATATRYPTNASWRSAYKTFLLDVCARLRGAGYYVAGNARAFYSADPGPTNDGDLTKTWWNYLSSGGVSYFDNLMVEFWQMTPTVGTPVRVSGHANNVLQEWDNWQTLIPLAHSLGADFGASQSPFGNTARDNQAALYTRASLELEYDPTFLDSIQWRSGTALPPSEASYAFDLGAPTGDATAPQTNVSRREFDNGIVIVNHSAGTISQDGHSLASGEAYIGA